MRTLKRGGPQEAMMGKLLTHGQIEGYRRDGFVSPVRAMSGAQALAYRRALKASEARLGPMHYVSGDHLLLRLADELTHHGAILDAVEDIIGPDILLWDCAFIIKEP